MLNATPGTQGTPATPTHRGDRAEVSVLDLLLELARRRRLVGATVILFMAAGLLYGLLAESEFIASAKVVPEAPSDNISNLGGLAALTSFGINLGTTSAGLSVSAYPDVIQSREVRLAVVRDTFYFQELGMRTTYVEYVNSPERLSLIAQLVRIVRPKSQSPLQRISPPTDSTASSATLDEEIAIEAISDLISTTTDRGTGIMTISATATTPELSAAIVNSVLTHLTNRVRDLRTEKARANLEFIKGRFEDAANQLRQAENDLAYFLDRNNNPQTATLRTHLERLQRKVSFSSQLYQNLQTELTQAELDFQRTQPVITVVEHPVPPVRPNALNLKLLVIASAILGSLFASVLILTHYFLVTGPSDTSDSRTFRDLRAALQYVGTELSLPRRKHTSQVSPDESTRP